MKQRAATDAPQPEIFQTYRQLTTGIESDAPLIVMRSTVDPMLLVPARRTIVREQNSTLALDGVMTMEERLSSSLAEPRLYAIVRSRQRAHCRCPVQHGRRRGRRHAAR